MYYILCIMYYVLSLSVLRSHIRLFAKPVIAGEITGKEKNKNQAHVSVVAFIVA